MAWLRATRLSTGLALGKQRVRAAPAEWGIQQKFSFRIISNPAVFEGRGVLLKRRRKVSTGPGLDL